MDELKEIFQNYRNCSAKLTAKQQNIKNRLNAILYDTVQNPSVPLRDTTNLSPQPEQKRPKRLTAVDENDETAANVTFKKSPRRSPRSSSRNAKEDAIQHAGNTLPKCASELMPPPRAPNVVNSSISDLSSSRPKRAAKLDCEKHLKEPSLRDKLRRPTDEDLENVKIKVEHVQSDSQMHGIATVQSCANAEASSVSQDSIVVLPSKEISVVSISSELESTATRRDTEIQHNESTAITRTLRVRVKREKLSTSMEQIKEPTQPIVQPNEATNVESSMMANTILTTEVTHVDTTQTKKPSRKKKFVPKPIKVEHFSDADENKVDNSVSSRTRNKDKSVEKTKQFSDSEKPLAKDQVVGSEKDGSPKTMSNVPASVNETVNTTKQALSNGISDSTMVLGTAPNDATYCTASAATFVLEAQNPQPISGDGNDLTFNVANEKTTESQQSSMQSMETARDTLQPHNDSLMTEDESYECANSAKAVPPPQAPKIPLKHQNGDIITSAKTLPMPNKACKMPVRTIEIFNPLVQSPVKKKVEAFEHVAAAQAASTSTLKRTRSKQAKENGLNAGSTTTPIIGKLPLPTVGRFLTPSNQQSNATVTLNAMAQTKKVPVSASKAQTIMKSNSAGNLKATSSAKAPLREKSCEDFRKGLHQMAEERKKQREQKHLLAAQQREAKERERAERMAKVAKEREEKRLKKQQEAEQRKRELEEIQKKLRAQEEIAAAEIAKHKAKVQMEQEKIVLEQMSTKSNSAKAFKARMPPPQPKIQKEYTFEMLHEDDSTDDENKTSYKRPAPPTWSRSQVRGPAILQLQRMPTDIIDSFFSVEPMTPDLKEIFPAIDPRYLKRNSSVVWSTPPRYSELPKF